MNRILKMFLNRYGWTEESEYINFKNRSVYLVLSYLENNHVYIKHKEAIYYRNNLSQHSIVQQILNDFIKYAVMQ